MELVSFALLCTCYSPGYSESYLRPRLEKPGSSVNVYRHGSVYTVVSCLVFHNLVGWFSRPRLVFRNRPTVLFKLVFGGKSASLASAAALPS